METSHDHAKPFLPYKAFPQNDLPTLNRIYLHHEPYANLVATLHQDRTGSPDGGYLMSYSTKIKFTKSLP